MKYPKIKSVVSIDDHNLSVEFDNKMHLTGQGRRFFLFPNPHPCRPLCVSTRSQHTALFPGSLADIQGRPYI
jgi:hypothetical protein